jgi:ribosomal protein L40E
MSREDWKKRLMDAKLPEDVVDALLASTKDEDLVRMKEMTPDEIIESLRQTLLQDKQDMVKCPKCGAMNPEGSTECKDCKASLEEKPPAETKDDTTVDVSFNDLLTRIKEMIESQEIEVEVPALQGMIDEMKALKDAIIKVEATNAELSTSLKEMYALWKGLAEADETKLKDLATNLSPAQKIRLRTTLSEPKVALDVIAKDNGNEPADGVMVIDANGVRYASMTAYFKGEKIEG